MNKADLLDRFKIHVETVEHDGETYHVRSLGVRDKIKISSSNLTEADAAVFLILRSLSDEAGKRVLSDDDVEIVDRMPIELITKLNRASMTACGLTPEGYEAIEKN